MISILKEDYYRFGKIKKSDENIRIKSVNYYIILFWFIPIRFYTSTTQQ
jgi:hypothetical protein